MSKSAFPTPQRHLETGPADLSKPFDEHSLSGALQKWNSYVYTIRSDQCRMDRLRVNSLQISEDKPQTMPSLKGDQLLLDGHIPAHLILPHPCRGSMTE